MVNDGNLFSKYHHPIIIPSLTINKGNYNTNPKSQKYNMSVIIYLNNIINGNYY